MALALAAFTDKIQAGILDPTGVVSNFYYGGNGWSYKGEMVELKWQWVECGGNGWSLHVSIA